MSSHDTSNESLPVFEVHRIGTLDKASVASRQLSDLSKSYTELVPITSLAQFANASALATIPPPNHMIVDRNGFKDMVAKSAKDIAAKTTEQSIKRMEESIQTVIEQSAAEIGSTLSLISDIIQTEQASLKTNMEQLWNDTDGSKSEDLSRRKEALDSALISQQTTLQRIFDLVIAKKSTMKRFEFDSTSDESQSIGHVPTE